MVATPYRASGLVPGSQRDRQLFEFIAGKRPVEFCFLEAAISQRQRTTPRRHAVFLTEDIRVVRQGCVSGPSLCLSCISVCMARPQSIASACRPGLYLSRCQ